MANVSAVKSGNWSDPTVWSTGSLPTSADDVYSAGFNVTIDQNVTVLSIRQSSVSVSNTGGTFVLTNGITVSATSGGFISRHNSFTGGFIIFNLAAPNSATLIGNINHQSGDAVFTVDHLNTGTLNIIGNLIGAGQSSSSNLRVNSTGTVNITGNLLSNTSTNSTRGIIANTNCIINITGDIIWQSNIGSGVPIINIGGAATLNITGTVYGGASNGISSIGASYIKVIGSIIGGVIVGGTTGSPAISSTNASAINIFTGPFISHSSGILPLYVTRMHYQRTLGSYYEFRDSSTNGALPPAAAAPATRLNSPEVGSDLPTVANVRFGTTYGYGSLVGTLRMPTANQVTYGVAVDNTFGAAVLTAASVWDYLVDNITTANSIGLRLKNVATPQTVGSQLASLL